MKKTALMLLLYSQLFVGQNLVNNPSFEDHSACPVPNSFVGVNNWYQLANHSGSPDYYNACSQMVGSDIPTNYVGSQIPYFGNAYIGIWSYNGLNPNMREYVQTQLATPMVAGQTYYISFFVSLADECEYAINNIGAAITNDAIGGNGTLQNLGIIPQINFPTIISDKENWTLVSGTYQAIGGERYVTLGNFYNDAQTAKIFTTVFGGFNHAYYYVDNVTVSTDMMGTEDIPIPDGLQVYPNPFTAEVTFNIDDIQQVRVYSATQLVKNVYGNSRTLDLGNLSSGIYFIVVNAGDKVLTKKVIKNK